MDETAQMSRPRLRPCEAVPIERDGNYWIVLHDPSGLAAQVALSPHAFFIVSHFQGEHTVPQIQAAFVKQFGQMVMSHQVHDLIRQLDEALLLDSPRFAECYRARVEAYLAGDARPMREDALPDRETLDRLMDRIVRPRELCEAAARAGRLVGLVAPHLDYPRGLPCYGSAYGTLAAYVRERPAPALVIVLGTNHYASAAEPIAADKAFVTPYGRIPADGAAVRRLCELCERDLLAHQFDHVREHSVELQVTVLARLLGEGRFRMVGVLLPDVCERSSRAQMDVLAEAIAQLIDERDEPVLVVAGADLSHVGRRFDDDRDLEPVWLAEVARSDRTLIADLSAGDAAAFADRLRATRNATRICSTGALYVLRRALRGATWQDLGYHQATDVEAGTSVSCMAAALWRP